MPALYNVPDFLFQSVFHILLGYQLIASVRIPNEIAVTVVTAVPLPPDIQREWHIVDLEQDI